MEKNREKEEEYVPYGPEWEKEIMKFPKMQIIKILAAALQKNKLASEATTEKEATHE